MKIIISFWSRHINGVRAQLYIYKLISNNNNVTTTTTTTIGELVAQNATWSGAIRYNNNIKNILSIIIISLRGRGTSAVVVAVRFFYFGGQTTTARLKVKTGVGGRNILLISAVSRPTGFHLYVTVCRKQHIITPSA